MLELAALIRASSTSRDRNFHNGAFRDRILSGRDQVPIVRWCNKCDDECFDKYTGKVLLVIGLNNTLKAGNHHNVKMGPDGHNINAQDFEGMFKYMDETLALMLPRAEIKFSPMIASGDEVWKNTPICQEAYAEIDARIKARNHINFDSFQPEREGWLNDRDLVHMKDWESIDFWMKAFEQI